MGHSHGERSCGRRNRRGSLDTGWRNRSRSSGTTCHADIPPGHGRSGFFPGTCVRRNSASPGWDKLDVSRSAVKRSFERFSGASQCMHSTLVKNNFGGAAPRPSWIRVSRRLRHVHSLGYDPPTRRYGAFGLPTLWTSHGDGMETTRRRSIGRRARD